MRCNVLRDEHHVYNRCANGPDRKTLEFVVLVTVVCRPRLTSSSGPGEVEGDIFRLFIGDEGFRPELTAFSGRVNRQIPPQIYTDEHGS
jgi:hypothetical protein